MFRKFRSFISVVTLTSFAFSLAITGKDVAQTDMKGAPDAPDQVQKDYGKMPILFEENKGQTKTDAKFILRGKGYQLYLTEGGAVYSLQVPGKDEKSNEPENSKKQRTKGKSEALKMSFVGANKNPAIKGIDEAVTKTNYYIGKKKFVGLSNYEKVSYQNLYNGVDAIFYGNANNQLEYDFIVAPNTDTNQIKLNFDGAKDISLNDKGDLILKTENAELVQQKPIAYQIIDGNRKEVAVSYKLTEKQISFELGEYDKSQPLTIDPVLNYLTYAGGTHCDVVDNVAVDAQGNAFIVGSTCSLNYPVPNSRTESDFAVFVTKISADGSTILYNTFLDGNDHDGISSCFNRFIGNDIAIDASGNAYITGTTDSGDFPITDNAYQSVRLCSRQFGLCIFPEEVYVSKLNASGTIVYSTFLGGRNTDFANGIAVDSAGKAYVTGGTHSGLLFPTKNSYQGTGVFGSTGSNDAFITVLNASGSDILYSSGLGGNSYDTGNAIVLDTSNNAYITGMTESEGSFPTKTAFQPDNNGGTDAFVAKFNTSLSNEASLIYSTFLGGAGTDRGNGIAVNSSNQAVVVGITGSFNFPLLNAFRSTNQINEAFVTVLSSTGASLANSSFLGGADQETANGVALGVGGNIYVTGSTRSSNFPTALPFQATLAGDRDAFVTKLRFGTGVISSSYLGGSDFDTGKGIAFRGNTIFVVGTTFSDNLATTSGVIQPTFGGDTDGFVAKILDTRLDSVGVFRPQFTHQITQSTTNIVTQTLSFTTPIGGNRGVSGDFNGDGIDSTGSFTDGVWKVRDINFPITNITAKTINFGQVGDLPVVGDWNNDGIDTPGVYRIIGGQGQFLLTNSTSTSPTVDITVNFGLAGDLPIGGDWDADGFDSVGVFRPSASTFFLTNANVAAPTIDFVTVFGIAEDLPIAGDFDGDGVDTISVWRPSTREFFLSNNNVNVDANFVFGLSGGQPMVGDWDGRPIP